MKNLIKIFAHEFAKFSTFEYCGKKYFILAQAGYDSFNKLVRIWRFLKRKFGTGVFYRAPTHYAVTRRIEFDLIEKTSISYLEFISKNILIKFSFLIFLHDLESFPTFEMDFCHKMAIFDFCRHLSCNNNIIKRLPEKLKEKTF